MSIHFTHPIKKILVIRPDRLGDVILTLPVVNNLKENFPDADIVYLCTEYTSQILRSYSLISDLIIYDQRNKYKGMKGIFRLGKDIKDFNFDLAVHLLPRFPLALATYLSQIRYSIGTGFRWYSFLFTHRQYEHRKHNQYHEAEYNLRLLYKIGTHSTNSPDAYTHFNFPAKVENAIQNIISKNFGHRPFIILHPGSGGSSIDWPLKNYIKLIQLLNHWGKYEIGLSGVSSEKDFLSSVYASNTRFVDFVGAFDLNALAAFLKHADLFISNSTGPLHLAVAMGTPVLGFYPLSPGLGPGRWGPYGQSEHHYMTPQVLYNGKVMNTDMYSITAEAAFERIRTILV
jgi:heptosyltransferase-3